MAKQGISTGTTPNDGTGDTLLTGAVKVNENFSEVYTLLGDGTTLTSNIVNTIVAGDNISVSGATGNVTVTGIGTADIDTDRINVSGVVTATSFTGSGANLTSLPAGQLTGTINDARLPSTITSNITGNVTGNVTGNLTGDVTGDVTGSGANLTSLPAGQLTGTVSDDRLPATITSDITGDVTGNLTGNVSGNVSGTASGLSGTPNITVAKVNATTVNATGIATVTNSIQIKSDDATPGRVDFYCESNNAHYVRLKAPAHAQFSGNATVTLPNADGTVLSTAGGDGSALSGVVTSIVAGSNVTVSNTGGVYTIASSGGGGGGGGSGFFSQNTTGIHTLSSVGIGTTTANGNADPNNTTILSAGIVKAVSFAGDGSGLTGLTGVAGTFGVGYASTTGDTPLIIGAGVTQLNFVGTGYTVTASGNVTTVRHLGMGMTTLSVTSVGYGVTVNAGSQISYTATASDANAKFHIEDAPAGIGQIGINYDSGVMGGGQNATAGTYKVRLRAATFFGLSEPKDVSFTVSPFTLSMNTMFGDPTTFVMNTDTDDDATYISLSTGGVVSWDGSAYVIDRTNANYTTATKHALYYDNTNNVLYGFRTNSSNNAISGIYKWTSVTSASHGTSVGSGTGQQTSSWATTGAVSASSGIHTSSSGAGIAAYQPGGNYSHFYGSAFAMTIATTGGIMNNFGTGDTDWAYGFTLEDPWLATGAGNQLLAPESSANGWHNFGVALFNIGTTEYDYICYGENGYGPYTTGSFMGAVSRLSNTNNIANAGDTVQVRFDGTGNGYYYLYINGVLKITTSSPDTYMTNTNTTNPTLSFGDTSNQNGGTIINDYAKGMPWPFRIRDMWIANNGNISASDLSGVATLNNRNVNTWSEYSDVDVYFTMDASGITAVKGSPTVARKSITFS